MAKRRGKFFETRIFGFVIAFGMAGIVAAITFGTGLVEPLRLKTLDSYSAIRLAIQNKTLQEGVTGSNKNPKISDDIMIVGIDFNSLTKYGRWPFPRFRHADLVNAFSRIKDQSQRENSLFLDIFFIDPTDEPKNDALLLKSIQDSGRVFLETSLSPDVNSTASADEMEAREKALYDEHGSLKRVSGPWQTMPAFYSAEPPLADFGAAAAGYGHANFSPDADEAYRKQPLVSKESLLLENLKFEDLKPGYTVNLADYERLAWMDKDGLFHNIATPLSAGGLAVLRKELERSAPLKMEDTNSDGVPDEKYYIVRKFKDYFVPSITLTLALNYFGKTLDDAEVVIGKRIRIDNPTVYDADAGARKPYELQLSPDQYDANGNLVKAGKKRAVPFIDIPIDENGLMLINFMGPPSSDSPEGLQTYPVRSYAGYADKAPTEDAATWRRTMAAENKIVMVGAFATGMAADQKPTPLGLMYGIELHANALNTILMDNFIHYAPFWLDLLIMAVLVFVVAFMSSRLPAIFSFFGTLVLVVALFFGGSLLFDNESILVNFASPAIAMIFSFVGIVVYRAMTEERDKRKIRETFGKYLSPKVVDQLVENPPELGGVDKELSVLFSDIRSFTTLSETMSPQELVNHLNTYLTAMTNVIFEDGGYLDKYVGDEVMCFWGAPLPQADHALRACRCALRQMAKLRELNSGWPEAIKINIGIGVNSGVMTVGNMGSPTKMNYTLMGDNVNLGARLEGTNKEYGTNIIISEYTYGLVRDKVIVRELDNIRVKGKNKPVLIYELVGMADESDMKSLGTDKNA
jgi:adenylate cyclase